MTVIDTGPRSRGQTFIAILRQSWPILVSQWASMAFGVLDTAMTGHSSPTDLAAMALAVSVYITVFVGLMGVMHALLPIQAQYVGAGKLDEVGRSWGQGIWVSLVLSVIGGATLMFPNLWLSFSGNVAPEVRARMAEYLLALTFALPAALMFRTVYALANAVSRPKLIMTINLAGIALKVLLNWLLIFGNGGLPALGAPGAGIASGIVYCSSHSGWSCAHRSTASFTCGSDAPIRLPYGRSFASACPWADPTSWKSVRSRSCRSWSLAKAPMSSGGTRSLPTLLRSPT